MRIEVRPAELQNIDGYVASNGHRAIIRLRIGLSEAEELAGFVYLEKLCDRSEGEPFVALWKVGDEVL